MFPFDEIEAAVETVAETFEEVADDVGETIESVGAGLEAAAEVAAGGVGELLEMAAPLAPIAGTLIGGPIGGAIGGAVGKILTGGDPFDVTDLALGALGAFGGSNLGGAAAALLGGDDAGDVLMDLLGGEALGPIADLLGGDAIGGALTEALGALGGDGDALGALAGALGADDIAGALAGALGSDIPALLAGAMGGDDAAGALVSMLGGAGGLSGLESMAQQLLGGGTALDDLGSLATTLGLGGLQDLGAASSGAIGLLLGEHSPTTLADDFGGLGGLLGLEPDGLPDTGSIWDLFGVDDGGIVPTWYPPEEPGSLNDLLESLTDPPDWKDVLAEALGEAEGGNLEARIESLEDLITGAVGPPGGPIRDAGAPGSAMPAVATSGVRDVLGSIAQGGDLAGTLGQLPNDVLIGMITNLVAETDPAGDALGTAGMDDLVGGPTGSDPMGTDSMGDDPMGADAMGTDPMGTDSIDTDPMGTDAMGTDANDAGMDVDPAAGDPSSDQFEEPYDDMVAGSAGPEVDATAPEPEPEYVPEPEFTESIEAAEQVEESFDDMFGSEG
jgi:hypothetical protein